MSVKIVGRIDAVEYTGKVVKSIRFIPDQEYSLTINGEKIAVFVNEDNRQSTDAKNLVYKKYLTIMCKEFTNIPDFLSVVGKKIELVLMSKSKCAPVVKVTINADDDSSREEEKVSQSLSMIVKSMVFSVEK